MSLAHFLTTITLLLFAAGVLIANPLLSSMPSLSPETGGKSWFVGPVSSYSSITWEGRSLNLLEVGAEAKSRSCFLLGACLRTSSGHGTSSTNSYKADGWHVYGEMPLISANGTRPGVSLFADQTVDDTDLDVSSSSTRVMVQSAVTITGGGVQMTLNRNNAIWHAQTGVFHTSIENSLSSNTLLCGAGVGVILNKRFSGYFDITGYREDYLDNQMTVELSGIVTLWQTARGNFTVGGHLFPYGIPMGGTPLSTISSVGMIYGQSAAAKLRDSTMGYFTVSGELNF